MQGFIISIWVLVYPIHYPETNTTVTSTLEYRSEEVCVKYMKELGKGQCVPQQVAVKINSMKGRKNVTATIFDRSRD